MTTYIALLRGINVGGKNIVKMADLKTTLQDNGFLNIETYIQSGNLVFMQNNEPEKNLAERIKNSIQAKFGLSVPVLVFSLKAFELMVANNPFLKTNPLEESSFHITFLSEKIQPLNFEIEAQKLQNDQAIFAPQAVYLLCASYGQTKITPAYLEKKLNVSTTTRNIKTCQKLIEIALNLTNKYA